VVVTGKTLGASRLLDQLTAALGARCLTVYNGAQQHVPLKTIRALVTEIKRTDADCLISFGGGSPIDTAKVAAASILTGRDPGASARHIDVSGANAEVDGKQDLVEIAVPPNGMSASGLTRRVPDTDPRCCRPQPGSG
jgi:alcohol dehydrogenase class IV